MEFLYRLYSNNYFGIGLFIVITVLAFTFLIILFFGKKDQKAREEKALQEKKVENVPVQEETKEPVTQMDTIEPITLNEEIVADIEPVLEEEPILTSESIVEEEPISLEEPVAEEIEIFEEKPMEEMDPFVTSNIVLNTDYITEQPTKEEQQSYPDTASDIYNLDSIINDDVVDTEESIDDVLNKYDAIEETMLKEEPKTIIPEEPEIEISSIKEEEDLNIFERPGETQQKASTPFSSVYLTKEEAETKKEETIVPTTPVTPSPLSRSNFEMPKRMDLPKRNASAINENIISSMSREANTTSPFDSMEEDSYNINR